jgi:hypothetical protein
VGGNRLTRVAVGFLLFTVPGLLKADTVIGVVTQVDSPKKRATVVFPRASQVAQGSVLRLTFPDTEAESTPTCFLDATQVKKIPHGVEVTASIAKCSNASSIKKGLEVATEETQIVGAQTQTSSDWIAEGRRVPSADSIRISKSRYLVGGIFSTVVGLGSGHFVLRRPETGAAYLLGEVAGAALAANTSGAGQALVLCLLGVVRLTEIAGAWIVDPDDSIQVVMAGPAAGVRLRF